MSLQSLAILLENRSGHEALASRALATMALRSHSPLATYRNLVLGLQNFSTSECIYQLFLTKCIAQCRMESKQIRTQKVARTQGPGIKMNFQTAG
jgi:hypothetical protein